MEAERRFIRDLRYHVSTGGVREASLRCYISDLEFCGHSKKQHSMRSFGTSQSVRIKNAMAADTVSTLRLASRQSTIYVCFSIGNQMLTFLPRAAGDSSNDASAVVQNFLNSLKGGNLGTGGGRQQADKPFTTLPDLLASSVTIPVIDAADDAFIDSLVSHLPPMILLLAQEIDDVAEVDPTSDTAQAAIAALSSEQKRGILKRVLRSPQMHQSLGSLTMALRDGGLPTVSEALKVKVQNGGMRGQMPLGGGEAVEAFLSGVKKTVEEEEGKMDTD